MEQLDQLIAMRDQAKERLEAALAAIEKSPDARLVNSLSTLIEDLQQALGVSEETGEDKASETEAVDAGAAEEPDPKAEAEVEAAPSEKKTADENATDKASAEDVGFSLEDSLEAELMGNDISGDTKGASATAN